MGLMELLGLKPKKDLSKCRFDNEAYWRDIENGVPHEVLMKKHKNLDYYVEVKPGESPWTFLK